MASYRIQLKDREGNLLFPNVLSNSNYVTDQELSDALTSVYTRIEGLSDSLSTLKGRVTSIESTLSAKLSRVIVDELPTTDISTTTIYMVPKDGSDSVENNVYTEYLYINGAWEIIGDTAVSLEGLITESDAREMVDTAISNALVDYAPLNSPALTGVPTTPDLSDSSVDGAITNKKYVDASVTSTYNTLNALIKLDYDIVTD